MQAVGIVRDKGIKIVLVQNRKRNYQVALCKRGVQRLN